MAMKTHVGQGAKDFAYLYPDDLMSWKFKRFWTAYWVGQSVARLKPVPISAVICISFRAIFSKPNLSARSFNL